MYDLIQGRREADIFSQGNVDNRPRTLAEAIKEVLKIDYNGKTGSNIVGVGSETGIERRRGSTGDVERGGRGTEGERAADGKGRAKGDTGEEGVAPFSERLQNAIAETETEPTEAQKKAGNYKKGHLSFGGYDFTVETPKGVTRSGKDEQGKPWSVTMHDTYGYILGKIGVDGDHIDMFINDAADLDTFDGNVYVVDQVNPETGEFDEHKVMYGYPSEEAATEAYLANYSKGWKGLGKVTSVSKATFDRWLEKSGRKTKAFSEYKNVKSESADSPKTGAFGTIYTQFKGKPQEAIAFLLEKKEGEAVGALHHKDIGDIDLVWGKEGTAKSDGFGLAKLAKYHPEVLGNLQEILDAMVVVKRTDNRVQLESETHQASVRLTWDSEKKNWLLTAFEKKNSVSDNTTDTVGTAEGGKRNDTATPQNTVSDGKDTEKVSSGQEDGEKSVLSDLEREFQKALEHEEDVEQKWEDKILDYVAEHYPTQATVSAETKSAKGLEEREAMKSDHVLRAMREKADAEYKEARDATFAAQKKMETAKEKEMMQDGAHSEAFDKIVDLAKEQKEYWDLMEQGEVDPNDVPEVDVAHKMDELLKTLSDEEFKEVSDVLQNMDEEFEYFTADEYERREDLAERKNAAAYSEFLKQETKSIAPFADALRNAVNSGDKKAIAKAQKELTDALLASNLGHGYLSGQLEYAKSAKKKDESYSERRAFIKPLTDAINAIESALDSALADVGLEGVHVDFKEYGYGWIYADKGSDWRDRLEPLDNDYRNVSQYSDVNPISVLPQITMNNVKKVAGIIKSRIEEGERYNSDENQDENIEEAKKTKDNLPFHRDVKEVKPSKAEAVLRDAVIDRLRENGMEVITDVAEGQKVLDEANGEDVMLSAKQKRALETVTMADESTNKATAISSADGAKVQNNLEILADNYEKRPNKTKGFITDLSQVLNLEQHEASHYGTFETRNGKLVTIRVSNHNARVSFFDKNGENDGISIVISNHKNKGLNNDGDAHVIEFFYSKQSLQRADSKPLSDIIRSFSEALNSGEFNDPTGLAERQEVNADDVISLQKVYHGSGADFDHFDHSHMGEGEGAQAYGWGTYVTEVEGIGRMYAEQNSEKAREHYVYSGDTHGLSEERINEILEVFLDAKPSEGHVVSEYNDALGWYSSKRDEDCQSLAKDASLLNPSDISIVVDKTRNLYTVEIPDDTGENYLDWDAPIGNEQIASIRKYLSDNYRKQKIEDFDASIAETKNAPNADEVNAWVRRGDNVYKTLAHLLGSDKEASKALSEMGFVGIKYPAEYRSGGRKDGAKNYVIFNEKDAKITDHVRFFKTKNGEAYGFTVGGKIYVDPRIATSETPVHEYAHLWASALRSGNVEEWQNVVGLMKDSKVWDEVKKRYPELETDDEIADEVIATYSGRRGAERLRSEAGKIAGSMDELDAVKALSALQRVKEALKRFWKGVCDFLHIHFTSAEEVADRVMKDLLDGVDPRSMMDGGRSLRSDTEINIVEGAKEHGFKNYAEAKTWAKGHIARTYSGEETGGKGDIRISNVAVDKYLSQSAVDKSDSKDVHLSVLKVLPDVIRESVDAEQHADYKKGEDGVRSAKNGINPNVTIHRLYGAVRMDGKV